MDTQPEYISQRPRRSPRVGEVLLSNPMKLKIRLELQFGGLVEAKGVCLQRLEAPRSLGNNT